MAFFGVFVLQTGKGKHFHLKKCKRIMHWMAPTPPVTANNPAAPQSTDQSSSSIEAIRRKVEAGRLARETEACKHVLGSTQPAKKNVDYGGTRLFRSKREELYHKYYYLRQKGVRTKAILARTLGLSRPTIYRWEVRYQRELQRRRSEQPYPWQKREYA